MDFQKYRGLCKIKKQINPWKVSINHNGKVKLIKYVSDPNLGAKMWDKVAELLTELSRKDDVKYRVKATPESVKRKLEELN